MEYYFKRHENRVLEVVVKAANKLAKYVFIKHTGNMGISLSCSKFTHSNFLLQE